MRRTMAHLVALLICCCTIVLGGLAGSATATEWVKADYVEGRLISTQTATGSETDLLLAIDLKLKPKWKTYWRSPGDAGLPPETDWSGSKNLAGAELLYPAPIRFQLFGLQTFGYEKRVVFPVRVKLDRADAALNANLKLNVLVCSDVCVPQEVRLKLHVPTGLPDPTIDTHLIQRAVSAIPSSGREAGHTIERAAQTVRDGVHGLSVSLRSEQPLNDIEIIPEAKPFVAFGAPAVTLSPDRKFASAFFALSQPLPAGETLAGRDLNLIVNNAGVASMTSVAVTDGGGASVGQAGMTLALMIAAALVGGFILNLMPCVLPVLSVKLLSIVEAKSLKPRRVRANFLATSAGIIASLLALASMLVAVKSAGLTVGWGIQFQQPAFIAAMAVIVTLFACNLWGLFEISLPSGLSNWAGRQGANDTSFVGHFLTGVFVTLLATPCSAPFVGTAVGFALASGHFETMAIFAALGLGLALPYLIVALVPGLVRFLPRPGVWMNTLRRVLALALVATAIWLLSVLAGQIGLFAAWIAGGLLIAVIAALVWRQRSMELRWAMAATGVALLLSVATVIIPLLHSSDSASTEFDNDGPIAWQAFDEKRLRSLIAQGKTVFVDVTADWCITCKANKRLVIDQPPVVDRLGNGITAMRADWTTPDPKITSFLARYGRYGIPMNVVFGPGRPQGIVLPELLTTDGVIDAINAARARSS